MQVEAVRNAFTDFLAFIYEKFSVLQVLDNTGIPETIEDMYEITHDLNGYDIDFEERNIFSSHIVYRNETAVIEFYQTTKGTYNMIWNNTKNINITDLDDININNLAFISCNSGNIDFIINDNSSRFNSKGINYGEKYSVYDEESQSYKTIFLNNLAVSYLSTHNNTINVYGADGYVQYVCSNINVIKKNEGSEYILAAGTDRWSLERKRKTRSPQDWVKYYKDNSIIKYTTNLKWKKNCFVISSNLLYP